MTPTPSSASNAPATPDAPDAPGTPGPTDVPAVPRADSESSSALARSEADESSSRDSLRARAEEDTTRELYARLINLLSQDGAQAREAPRKPPLEGALALVRRRWLPMVAVLALASLALTRVVKPGPPTFGATASMLLPPVPSAGGSAIAIDDGSDTVARQYDTDAQIAIITAPRIVERAWARMGRSPEDRDLKARGWGAEAEKVRSVPIQASALTSPSIIDITVSSGSMAASKRLANIVGGMYILDTQERTSEARQKDAGFVTGQANEVRKQLEAAQQELQLYKEKSGVNSAQSAITGSEQNIQALQQAADAAQTEASAGLGAQSIASDGTLASQRQAAEAARAALDALSVDFQPDAPRVVKARAAYRDAQAAADARAASLIGALQRRASIARAQLNAARGEAQKLPEVELQLNKLEGNVQRLNTTYSAIAQRQGSANLARNAYIAVPTFLRPATAESAAFGGRAKYLALSLLGGLMISALAGMMLERLDKGVHSPDDLRQASEAPVLGSLPALPASAEARLSHMSVGRGKAGSEARLLEAAYKLRSRLIAEAYKSGVRSILVTSPGKEPGKPLCALNIASALAFDGHRVLLVDADFQRPSQHKLADLPLSPGYSEVMGNKAEAEAAMRPSRVRNLWIMPAGEPPQGTASVSDMESEAHARRQMQQFAQAFDFVIVDSPPTLSLGDAQVLAALTDAVVLCVADSTPRQEVQRAEAVLRLTGTHLLGVVLNGDRSRQSEATAAASPGPYEATPPGQAIGALGPRRD